MVVDETIETEIPAEEAESSSLVSSGSWIDFEYKYETMVEKVKNIHDFWNFSWAMVVRIWIWIAFESIFR